MYFAGAEPPPLLCVSSSEPPTGTLPPLECREVLGARGPLESSRGERLVALPPCARSGPFEPEPSDPPAAAPTPAPRPRSPVLAKATRAVRWWLFFRTADAALAWPMDAPWEPSRADRRIIRAFRVAIQSVHVEVCLLVEAACWSLHVGLACWFFHRQPELCRPDLQPRSFLYFSPAPPCLHAPSSLRRAPAPGPRTMHAAQAARMASCATYHQAARRRVAVVVCSNGHHIPSLEQVHLQPYVCSSSHPPATPLGCTHLRRSFIATHDIDDGGAPHIPTRERMSVHKIPYGHKALDKL